MDGQEYADEGWGCVGWWCLGVPNWDRPVEVVLAQVQVSQGVSNLAQGLCCVREREGGMGIEVGWG